MGYSVASSSPCYNSWETINMYVQCVILGLVGNTELTGFLGTKIQKIQVIQFPEPDLIGDMRAEGDPGGPEE